MEAAVPPLRLVAWELTRSCVLHCRHCRASATAGSGANEFSTAECMAIVDSLARTGHCIVILTGGEPLLRDDCLAIARYGRDKGLRMVLATCGTLLDKARCAALVDAGIARISVSIDGATAAVHDAFRGVSGAFDGVMKGVEAASAAGLAFQVNTTITRSTLQELPGIYALAVKLGAVSFHPFLLVPTGRASHMADEVISAKEYERTLNWIYDCHVSSPITIKPTCAPHYYRIFRERERLAGHAAKRSAHGLDAHTGGCLGGRGFAFISHTGMVQICGFLEKAAGDLRSCGYDVDHIWRTSPLFEEIRSVDRYHGKCGRCEYRSVCGGCRARAFAVHNDYLGEEPQCLYQPAISTRQDTYERETVERASL
jgi:AdoMet-dependent heme synthase